MSDPNAFYHRKRHKAWRSAVLKRDGFLCVECKKYGRRLPNGEPVPATVAHHKLHADEWPEYRYVISNGEALCEACHNKRHPEKGGKNRGPRPSEY